MSIVKDALIEEIKEKAELSQEYYNIIQSAKTEAKKRLYQKKLKAHNNILADLIISLDKLNKSQYNSQDTNNNGNESDDECEQNRQD
jgi:hypothetical protein